MKLCQQRPSAHQYRPAYPDCAHRLCLRGGAQHTRFLGNALLAFSEDFRVSTSKEEPEQHFISFTFLPYHVLPTASQWEPED